MLQLVSREKQDTYLLHLHLFPTPPPSLGLDAYCKCNTTHSTNAIGFKNEVFMYKIINPWKMIYILDFYGVCVRFGDYSFKVIN